MSGGQYLMLFMTALLMMWLIKDFSQKEFRLYALVILLLLAFPLTAGLLRVYQTSFYGKENIWVLLPVTALLPLGLVTASEKMTQIFMEKYGHFFKKSSFKKQIFSAVSVAVLTVLLFLCGSLSLGKTMTQRGDGYGRIPAKEEAALKLLEIPADDFITLVAPDEVVTWARIYSGRILLPAGRIAGEPELSAFTYDACPEEIQKLHDWVNDMGTEELTEEEKTEECRNFLEYCVNEGYQYLMFTKERIAEESLAQALKKQTEYSLYKETEGYVIYRLP